MVVYLPTVNEDYVLQCKTQNEDRSSVMLHLASKLVCLEFVKTTFSDILSEKYSIIILMVYMIILHSV